jgi:hypothetical protein
MALQVVASERNFAVWHGPDVLKTVPIKHLQGQPMLLEEYFALMVQEPLATHFHPYCYFYLDRRENTGI